MFLLTFSFVQIYDGSKNERDLLGRFCNWTPPPTYYISRSNILHLRFNTDGSANLSGFRILYNIIKGKLFIVYTQNIAVRGDRDSRANLMPIYGDLYQIKL